VRDAAGAPRHILKCRAAVSRARGTPEKVAEGVNILRRGIADNDVSEPALAPRLDIERELARVRGACAERNACPFLKDEHRHLVLPHFKEQLRTGTVFEIGEQAADQLERRVLQLGNIKGERQLAGKPWFHGVAISRHYVDRVGAGQCGHMKIGQLGESLLSL